MDNYKERKEAGFVTIEAQETDAIVLAVRRFSPITGEELPPVQEVCSLEKLRSKRDFLAKQLADAEELLKEFAKPINNLDKASLDVRI